jgi:hypothetical protein
MAKKYIVKIGGKEAEVEFESDADAINTIRAEAVGDAYSTNVKNSGKIKKIRWSVYSLNGEGEREEVGYGDETGEIF